MENKVSRYKFASFAVSVIVDLHLILYSINWTIGLMSRVFANGPGDWGSIPGWVIPKTKEMVLDAALLNTQHYKVRIEGKVEQSKEWSSALLYTLVW